MSQFVQTAFVLFGLRFSGKFPHASVSKCFFLFRFKALILELVTVRKVKNGHISFSTF